jgi:hypothetical protein
LADELNRIKNAKLKQITKHKIRNLVHETLMSEALACQKQNDVYDKTLFSNMAQMSKYTSFVMLIFIAISVLVINDKSV